MSFQVIIDNRLGTEQAVATQAQLNLLPDLLNQRPHLTPKKLGAAWLHKCEQLADVPNPFPHNPAMFSIGASIEDIVMFSPMGWIEWDAPSGLFLGEWVTEAVANERDQSELYSILREFITSDELFHFDMRTMPADQANFILLVANAYYTEHEEDPAKRENSV